MNSKFKEIFDAIQRKFEIQISQKTGWGKNEIKDVYNKVCIDVLSKELSLYLDNDSHSGANIVQVKRDKSETTFPPDDDDLPF